MLKADFYPGVSGPHHEDISDEDLDTNIQESIGINELFHMPDSDEEHAENVNIARIYSNKVEWFKNKSLTTSHHNIFNEDQELVKNNKITFAKYSEPCLSSIDYLLQDKISGNTIPQPKIKHQNCLVFETNNQNLTFLCENEGYIDVTLPFQVESIGQLGEFGVILERQREGSSRNKNDEGDRLLNFTTCGDTGFGRVWLRNFSRKNLDLPNRIRAD